jgi:PKD repeat protein
MKPFSLFLTYCLIGTLGLSPLFVHAQDLEEEDLSVQIADAASQSFIGKPNDFSIGESRVPDGSATRDIVWNFGDGTRITGQTATHTYKDAGTYTVRLSLITDNGEVAEDTTQIRIFNYVEMLVIDNTFPEDQIEAKQQAAAREQVLLVVIRPKTSGPEAVIEEALTNQMLDARDAIKRARVIVIQTSGSVGVNVLSKLAQHIQQSSDISFGDLAMREKGVIMLSNTPFGVLTPSAQFAFNQLHPSYILLAKPEALDQLLEPLTAEAARQKIITSSLGHRLLGEFSARTIKDIGPTNFMSFGINYLVNQGVPINSISLILMLPVIATILSFSRQVIGMKAFGLVTPAMTTLSFLVMGLPYGLIIFLSILISGTLTRLAMRKLHLLYLPRMALVLTGVSLAILLVFGLGVATNNTALASFSIFPILILTLLAEEFIALQFKSGAKKALTVTAWTLALAIGCYFIVSWQIVRTLFVSYPEIVLLAIPINVLLGRWTGLRLTEYLRFRRLLSHIS